MAGPRGSIKGTVLESRFAFLKNEGGERLVNEVLAELSDADKQTLTRGLLPMGWYPFELNERLDQAIARTFRQRVGRTSAPFASDFDDETFRMLGAYSASHNLGSAHKVYVKERDPHGLLKQSASIFRLYYDTGNRSFERLGDKKAVLRTYECASFSTADCLTVVGWHEKAIELCGGKDPHVTEMKCRARGDALCEYVCEWT